jgi:hypothetical protein
MAHYAEIDENNIVLRVLVVDDRYDHDGHDFLANTCGLGGTWIKTSYNTSGGEHALGGTPLRKNYAGIGSIYDAERDAFYDPQPYPSWTLNEDTCTWKAPVEKPTGPGSYTWNEEDQEWVEIAVSE